MRRTSRTPSHGTVVPHLRLSLYVSGGRCRIDRRARTRDVAAPIPPLPLDAVRRSLNALQLTNVPDQRPGYPPVETDDVRARALDYLPIIFHENVFFNQFLLLLESIWEPLEQRQDHLPMYFDPRTSPASLVAWLASWLDMRTPYPLSEGRLRALAVKVSEFHKYRGTRYALARLLEVCTGLSVDVSETTADPFVLRIRIHGSADRRLIEALINTNKPAHCGYTLQFEE